VKAWLRSHDRTQIALWRLAILVVVLAAWEWLPDIHALRAHIKWLDPFFISSPSRVAQQIERMVTGSHQTTTVWHDLGVTVEATVVGTAIGILVGTCLGALLSNNDRLAAVLKVYIATLNAMPRVALIPVIVIIVGPGVTASMVACAIIVTFLTFFNAFEGGRSVSAPILQNARVLRATSWQVMVRIRLPNVLIWVFAAIPNAIAFGLVSVVTTELLTGTVGMGGLMLTAASNLNADLSFAVMIILSVVGVVLVVAGEKVKDRVLHWR
jgi:NitT/TauT family transport system permease protein